MINPPLEKALYRVQKPGRYIGGEKNSVMKDPDGIDIRFALCYPDLYEIGMSNLGIKILYELLNKREDTWCERVFAPAADMETQMREGGISLYGLESKEGIGAFDFIGFTLQFELNYSNVLQMLELSGVPLYARERGEGMPVVIAGGPCSVNSEPVADFLDLVLIGDGEESLPRLMDLYARHKKAGLSRAEFLQAAAQLENVYRPADYEIQYGADGGVISIAPQRRVRRAVIRDLNECFIPKKPVVPIIQATHDRVALELFRGCIRGCRFCQAGMLYRPARWRNAGLLNETAGVQCAATGYDEISLLSLSSSDYPEIGRLLEDLTEWTSRRQIRLSLPSLRIDNMPAAVLEKIGETRKTGLTFAPEAGSQRLRDAINKNITEPEILDTCRTAFEQGHDRVKLYFMLGLPTETEEDILAIAELSQKIVDLYYSLPTRQKGKGVSVGVSLSTFVPKPFTPFQWEGQLPGEEIRRRQRLLLEHIRTKKITVRWNDFRVSALEAAFARGDRRLAPVIETAYRLGARFDGWDETLDHEIWEKAFARHGLDIDAYAKRRLGLDEVLPWDMVDIGLTKAFLQTEHRRAQEGVTTPDCLSGCAGCGMAGAMGGKCFG